MIEITITVREDNENGEVNTMTKTAKYTPCNPLFYADATRQLGQRLTNELADQLDALHPQGDRPVGPASV
jgi:hypothetical protein